MINSAKHTPGPWAVQVRKRNRICGPDGVIVAEAWYPPARARRDAKMQAWEQGNTNARLIALAPEMHGLLSRTFDFLGGVDGATTLRGEIADTIAKAEREI